MAGYTRQSSFSNGEIIKASDHNSEYNALDASFHNTTGHAHDGTADEGPVIGLIGDNLATPLNKVQIDTANNDIGFWIDVSSSAVEQIQIADGVVRPVTDSDIDLGTTSLRFKDAYIDTITTTGAITLDSGNIALSSGNIALSNTADITWEDSVGGTPYQFLSLSGTDIFAVGNSGYPTTYGGSSHTFTTGGLSLGGSGSGITFSGGGNNDITSTQQIRIASNTDDADSASSSIVFYAGSITGANQVLNLDPDLSATFAGDLLVGSNVTIKPGATSSGDKAAIGYATGSGLILTGQGSTNDVTIKNDANQNVLEILTGTRNVRLPGGDLTLTTGDLALTAGVVTASHNGSASSPVYRRAGTGTGMYFDGVSNGEVHIASGSVDVAEFHSSAIALNAATAVSTGNLTLTSGALILDAATASVPVGVGQIFNTAANGLIIRGDGSTYDVNLQDSGGNSFLRNPTGTTDVELPNGDLTLSVGDLRIANSTALQGRETGGTYRNLLRMTSGDIVELGATTVPTRIRSDGTTTIQEGDLTLAAGHVNLPSLQPLRWDSASVSIVGNSSGADYLTFTTSNVEAVRINHNQDVSITAGSLTVSDEVKSQGGSSAVSAGEGVLVGNSESGAMIRGEGSNYDVNIVNKNGNSALRVPTGTRDVTISAGNLDVAGGRLTVDQDVKVDNGGVYTAPASMWQESNTFKFAGGTGGYEWLDDTGAVSQMSLSGSGDLTVETSDGAVLTLKSTDTTINATNIVGRIDFETADLTDPGVSASIRAVAQGPGADTALEFYTGDASTQALALTIDNSQDLTVEGDLTLSAGNVIMSSSETPASASATGTQGTIAWDTNYIYVCTATNTWKRVAIGTW